MPRKTIFVYARNLRKNQTGAEKRLWQILRNRKLAHLKFRRQHPVGRFITDFYCYELSLVIEVDGSIHEIEEVKRYDAEREEEIKSFGIAVLRFTNEQVIYNPEIIEGEILKHKEAIPLLNKQTPNH